MLVVILTVLANRYAKLSNGHTDPRAKRHTNTEGKADAAGQHRNNLSPLFAALPLELGRDLISILADDHHIQMRTAPSKARLLMCSRDADGTLAALPGLRVHRSWWVNMDQATDFELRRGGVGTLTLSTGETVPVSRAMAKTVEQALGAC